MNVLCRHGHFAFYPRSVGEPSRFSLALGLPLERDGDFYTFPALKELPRYSIEGKTYGNLVATKTYEGRGAWDVFRENGWVYSLSTKLLVLKASISISIQPMRRPYSFVAQTPLLQPGSMLPTGQRILSYEGELFIPLQKLRLNEFAYE